MRTQLTDREVVGVLKAIQSGLPTKSIQREFGVTRSMIYNLTATARKNGILVPAIRRSTRDWSDIKNQL